MEFYTDVSQYKNNILLRGYKDGKRVKEEIPYAPYLFIPTKKSAEYKSVYGDSLERIDFDSIYEAKDFIKTYKDVGNFKIYGMDKFIYPFIYDKYTGNIKYDIEQIKVLGLDIEVDTEGGYPDIESANKHITAITMRIGNIRTVLGLKDFDKKKMIRVKDQKNIHYYKFDNEEDLLRSFIQLWDAADIDVVTGWNIVMFDIPYIVKRIKLVLNDYQASLLSPWKRLVERTIEFHGKEHLVYYPVGIAILDYMELYKKFTYTQRESYSLNYISHVELGVEKMDYSEYKDLAGLYRENHQLFIEYNIIDVDLIFQLEEKLRLIELVYAIAYDAKVNMRDALGSVLLWDVIIMNYLMDRKIAINPKSNVTPRAFEGAYVKDPIIGMHDWVVSFDATSLYPMLIQQYNISPETFIKRISVDSINDILNKKDISKYDGCSVAANGCVYRNDKYGFMPALMAHQFKLRSDYKSQMLAAKKEFEKTKNPELEKDVARFHNFQLAKKIQLNSAYGAFANTYFRWYDPNHAEAITLSGQLSIRWIANEVNSYLKKLMKNDDDYICAVDTDSIYVKFGPLVKLLNPNDPISFLDKLGKEKLEPFMIKKFDNLARITNSYANMMHMKRESIADKVIFRAKKNYIANVWDNEGVRYKEPQLKMMGIEAVRSSTPEICRNKIKETIKLIMTTDETTVQNFIKTFKKEYFAMNFEDIAFPRSVKNLSKYQVNGNKLYGFKTPAHTKAAIIYNDQIKKARLSNEYPIIFDGDKIKFAYLKQPNPVQDTVIGALHILPKELGIHEYIDYGVMFDKSFLKPIDSILGVIGWEAEHRGTLDALF